MDEVLSGVWRRVRAVRSHSQLRDGGMMGMSSKKLLEDGEEMDVDEASICIAMSEPMDRSRDFAMLMPCGIKP